MCSPILLPAPMKGIDYQRLASAVVDELEDRGLVGEGDELLTVKQVAERSGITTPTVYRRLNREGIPKRDVAGRPKDGGRSTTMISWSEWQLAEKLDTRIVRRNAGLT